MRAKTSYWLAGPAGVVAVLLAMLSTSCAGTASRRHEIDIEQLEYHPGELAVAEGDTVIWYNRDIVPHTVTLSGDDNRGDTVASGDSITIVVPQSGAHHYHCRFHPTMTGVLHVR